MEFLNGDLLEIIIHVTAGLGTVLLVYGIFLERERRQDAVFAIGSLALFVYALFVQNRVFMVAMGAFFIASLFEFVELIIGYHRHTLKESKDFKKEM